MDDRFKIADTGAESPSTKSSKISAIHNYLAFYECIINNWLYFNI